MMIDDYFLIEMIRYDGFSLFISAISPPSPYSPPSPI